MDLPKYTKLERERRWLAQPSVIQELMGLPYYEIRDLYLKCGRLRLRAIEHSVTQESQFKLCKKYGQISRNAEPIVNIYLKSEEELQNVPFPYVDAIEITGDQLYSGGSLARLEAEDLTQLLAERFSR